MKKPTEPVQIFYEMFNNATLRSSLFGPNLNPANPDDQQAAFTEFKGWVETMDDKLFGFITVK